MADPHGLGYTVKWPIYGARLNTSDYSSMQMALNDVETIIRTTLKEILKIDRKELKASQYYLLYGLILILQLAFRTIQWYW